MPIVRGRGSARQSMRRVVFRQGYLKKLPNAAKFGARIKKPEIRWFVFGVMNGNDPYLEYFESEEAMVQNTAINIIFLDTCLGVVREHSRHRYPNAFTLVLRERYLTLVASSRDVMSEWVRTFEVQLTALGILHLNLRGENDYVDIPNVTRPKSRRHGDNTSNTPNRATASVTSNDDSPQRDNTHGVVMRHPRNRTDSNSSAPSSRSTVIGLGQAEEAENEETYETLWEIQDDQSLYAVPNRNNGRNNRAQELTATRGPGSVQSRPLPVLPTQNTHNLPENTEQLSSDDIIRENEVNTAIELNANPIPEPAQSSDAPASALNAGAPASALNAGAPASALNAGAPASALNTGGPASALNAGAPASAQSSGDPASAQSSGAPPSAQSLGAPASEQTEYANVGARLQRSADGVGSRDTESINQTRVACVMELNQTDTIYENQPISSTTQDSDNSVTLDINRNSKHENKPVLNDTSTQESKVNSAENRSEAISSTAEAVAQSQNVEYANARDLAELGATAAIPGYTAYSPVSPNTPNPNVFPTHNQNNNDSFTQITGESCNGASDVQQAAPNDNSYSNLPLPAASDLTPPLSPTGEKSIPSAAVQVQNWDIAPPVVGGDAPPPYMPRGVLEKGANKSLRETQVKELEKQQKSTGGVKLVLKKTDCSQNIAFIECFNYVWIAGWNQKSQPFLSSALHIGDRIISINGQVIDSTKLAYKLIKQCKDTDKITFVIKRIPAGKIFLFRRERESQSLGIQREGGTGEIKRVELNSLAVRQGLFANIPALRTEGLCHPYITEINNRPLNLFYKDNEIETLLSAVGNDISLVVQPTDLINEFKKRLKAMRGYRDYLLD